MNCTECKELLAAYVEGLLAEPQKQAIESHLTQCPPCRAELAQLSTLRNRLTANGKALAQTDLESKVLDRIVREQNLKLRKVSRVNNQIQLWRKIMKSRITKLATAAAIIVIAALSITFLEKSATPAYAIEQTIEANHSVRYIHIKDFKVNEDEPKEFWFEFDEQGQVKNVRAYMPEWDSPSDGAKVTIWQQGKATVWFKKKKALLTIRDKRVAQQVLKMTQELDPKLAFERLREREKRGWVKIEIKEPSNKTESITVTVTYLPESPTPGKRAVLFVDQATRLVTAIETYQLKEDDYQYLGVMEFYDYNQRIEPEMFTLDNLPVDIMRIDQTTQEVGLVQGALSNEEIAVEVARQFFEALITKDYDKAGKLLEGIPGGRMQQMFGNIKVLRIISIGSAAPHPIPETQGLVVPCTVEIEKDGNISEWRLDRLGVRQVFNQPGRWTIFGGI